jgi:hypothetical protein
MALLAPRALARRRGMKVAGSFPGDEQDLTHARRPGRGPESDGSDRSMSATICSATASASGPLRP